MHMADADYLDEILLGNEKTTTIIDGSGVIHDPAGLNRDELVRLAKARKMINNFDKSKLSKDGYVVLVDEQDVKLPCELALQYPRITANVPLQLARSSLTALTSATPPTSGSSPIFSSHAVAGTVKYFPLCRSMLINGLIPRPEAVNISNVAALVDTEGKPHFKYIVEGANLFMTQQARLWLEKRKVVVIKDSSANKVRTFCA